MGKRHQNRIQLINKVKIDRKLVENDFFNGYKRTLQK